MDGAGVGVSGSDLRFGLFPSDPVTRGKFGGGGAGEPVRRMLHQEGQEPRQQEQSWVDPVAFGCGIANSLVPHGDEGEGTRAAAQHRALLPK